MFIVGNPAEVPPGNALVATVGATYRDGFPREWPATCIFTDDDQHIVIGDDRAVELARIICDALNARFRRPKDGTANQRRRKE